MAASAQDGAYQAPRTWFGDRNQHGVWANASFSTLERTDQFDTFVLTPGQAAVREAERNTLYEQYDKPEKVDGQLQKSGDPGGTTHFRWMKVMCLPKLMALS
ncbi:MAG: hypothetical protein P8L31_09900 [Pseudomonadales bacterium]|nr:hypothetical protein [Pseudomonadales bacterium]